MHHVLGIISWTIMDIDAMGHIFGMCAVLMETTTPFVNQRWFFAQSGIKSGVLYLVNGLVMTVLWFLLRILVFFWLGTRLFAMREQVFSVPLYKSGFILFSYAGGFSLQIFWFRKILKGALKAVGIGGGSTSEIKKTQD